MIGSVASFPDRHFPFESPPLSLILDSGPTAPEKWSEGAGLQSIDLALLARGRFSSLGTTLEITRFQRIASRLLCTLVAITV